MAFIPAQKNNVGSFTPTTNILDNLNSQDVRTLVINLYQYVNNLANVINIKESGFILNEEFCNSRLLFNPNSFKESDLRPCFQTAYSVGPLPAATLTTVPHNLTIDNNFKMVQMYGAASNTTTHLYVPLPYPDIGVTISLHADATNIYVNNHSIHSFDTAYVILEYVKI